jgi:hypothetical protein
MKYRCSRATRKLSDTAISMSLVQRGGLDRIAK